MTTNRTYGRVLIFSATALFFVGGVAAAQGQQPAGMGQQQQQPVQPGQLPGQAGQSPIATPGITPSTDASLADQAFVSSVFESDAAEEHLGQLAQQKSDSPDVKELGQKMMENRTKLD